MMKKTDRNTNDSSIPEETEKKQCRQAEEPSDHNHHHHDHQNTSSLPLVDVDVLDHAVIGTVKCRIPGQYEEAGAMLTEAMQKTAGDVESSGGLIGHIKAYVREECRTCMISITEAGDMQKKEDESPSLYVDNAAIVFGISGTELENILKRNFAAWL